MLKLLKRLILFRAGQELSKGVAHKLGLGPASMVVGLIGGLRYMRKHS